MSEPDTRSRAEVADHTMWDARGYVSITLFTMGIVEFVLATKFGVPFHRAIFLTAPFLGAWIVLMIWLRPDPALTEDEQDAQG